MTYNIAFTYNGIDYEASVVVDYFHHQEPDSTADNADDFTGYTEIDFHVDVLRWETEEGYAQKELICDAYDAAYQRWNNDLDRNKVFAIIEQQLLDKIQSECDNDIE